MKFTCDKFLCCLRLETGGLIIGWFAMIGSIFTVGFAIATFWYCAQDEVMVNGINLQYDNGQVQLMSKKDLSVGNVAIERLI